MWNVETLNTTVDDELEALPLDQRSKFIWITEIIMEHGLEKMREPHVKHLEQGFVGNPHEGQGWHIQSDLCCCQT